MPVKIMKWLAAATLLWGVLAFPNSGFQIVLEIVVCLAALLVFSQALNANKLIWAAGFLAIATLYNPVVPLRFSERTFFWLSCLCLITFLTSLVALKGRRQFFPASSTHQRPRGKGR